MQPSRRNISEVTLFAVCSPPPHVLEETGFELRSRGGVLSHHPGVIVSYGNSRTESYSFPGGANYATYWVSTLINSNDCFLFRRGVPSAGDGLVWLALPPLT